MEENTDNSCLKINEDRVLKFEAKFNQDKGEGRKAA